MPTRCLTPFEPFESGERRHEARPKITSVWRDAEWSAALSRTPLRVAANLFRAKRDK